MLSFQNKLKKPYFIYNYLGGQMLKRIILYAACATMFIACGDDSIINVNDEAKEQANISFLVLDSYTGEAVDSVIIYRPKDSKSNLTDSLGYSIWKKNNIGNYVFELSKEGYATVRTLVNVVEQGLGDVARVPDVTATVPMYKLGAEVSGTVLYTDKETGNKVPAEGVTVIITNQNTSIIPNEISVETDEDGNYTFSELPEGSNFIISIPQTTINEYKYVAASKISVQANRAGATVDLGVQNLNLISDAFTLVNSNLDEIDTNTTVTFSYSAVLDKDSVLKNIHVSKSGNSVLTNVSLSTDGKTINIKPFSGRWEDNEVYTISGTVYSKNGSIIILSKSFTVGGTTSTKKPGQISNLDAELSGSYLELSWTRKDSLATGYYIYYKTDSMSNYVRFNNLPSGYYTTTSIGYSSMLNNDADSTKISFIVLPYNIAGEADPNNAKSISYTFKAPTEQVTNLAVELSGSYAYLTWEAPATGTYNYRIYYKTPSMDEYAVLSTTPYTYYETNYTVSNYLNTGDESISFKVVPYSTIGESSLSKAAAATLSLAIDEVAGVAAEIDGTNFMITWNKVENASFYYVYYKTSSMSSYSFASTTSVLSSTLGISSYTYNDDTSISFKIIPYNSVVEGSLADAEEVTIPLSVPKQLTGLTGEVNGELIELSWNAPENDYVVGYYVYYKSSATTTYTLTTLDPTSNSISFDKTLYPESADTEISFKVIPTNDFGMASLEDALEVIVPLETAVDPL